MSSNVPMGTILPTALPTSSIPDGWLLCDGSAIPLKYQQLATFLGTSTTPNLIGRTLVGAGMYSNAHTKQEDGRNPQFNALTTGSGLSNGSYGGECQHTLGITEIPSHSHAINGGNFGYHNRSFTGSNDSDCPFETNPSVSLAGTDYTGGNGAHYNVQPYYAVNYIICAV